jgi:hypothetical protein
MEAKIYSVQSVYFHINKSNPPQLVVSAAGQVNSSGWSNGKLIPWIYIDQPADGIQDFDFVATAPSGMVLWVISPIGGEGIIELENWMKGVRVHTASNKSEIMLEDDSHSVDSRIISTMGIPQPN